MKQEKIEMHRHLQSLLVVGGIALFASCGGLSLDTYWRSERYVLIAIDNPGQMQLSFDEGGGTATSLVGPTVFAIGADEKYIVLMQHPSTNGFGAFDRSITNFFVVERTASLSRAERGKGVRGPLTKGEFEKLQSNLSLPKFTKTFDELQ